VTVQSAVSDLSVAALALAEAASSLRVSVCEDAPEQDRTMHFDEFCDSTLEFSATAEQMTRMFPALDEGELAAELVPTAVATVHARQNQARRVFHDRIAAPGHLDEMRRVTGRRPGWPGWLGAVGRAIDDCRAPLHSLDEVLLRSWSELVQRPEVRLTSATVGRLSVIQGDGADTERLTPIPKGT
jgi:hypothetical protein